MFVYTESIFRIDELVLPNKNFDSKVEDTIVGKLSIRYIAWEVLNPIGIKVELVAKRS